MLNFLSEIFFSDIVFIKMLNMSISATWIVLAVLILRIALKKSPGYIKVLLWGIVAVRLVCPFSLESIFSLIPSAETIPEKIVFEQTPHINSGVPIINNVVNQIIANSNPINDTASINPLQITFAILTAIWLLGITIMVLYTVISCLSLKLRLRQAVLYDDGIYVSDKIGSPFVFGVIKPKIYLPSGIEEREASHIIAHEMAHLRRLDHLWKPIGFLLLSVYWFNPAMWIAYILLCRDIELACDEKVIKELGENEKADYSETLLRCSVNRKIISACPLAFGEVGIKKRVKNVLNYKKPAAWIITLSVALCVVLAVCFLTNPKSGKNNRGNDDESKNIPLSLPENLGPLPYTFGSADLDRDGENEKFTVSELEENILYRLEVVKKDGSVIWSDTASIPHTDWNNICLCTLGGKDYLLRYNPSMWQGNAEYSYELFTLEVPNYAEADTACFIVDSGSVMFSAQPGDMPTAEYTAFILRINELLQNSTILLSTENSNLLYGGTSVSPLMADYSVFDGAENNEITLSVATLRGFTGEVTELDTMEYVSTSNTVRMLQLIEELDIGKEDFPNGYYIHNPETEYIKYPLSEKATFSFIDWGHEFQNADDKTSRVNTESTKDFMKYLATYNNQAPGMPFFITVKNGEIIGITEIAMP